MKQLSGLLDVKIKYSSQTNSFNLSLRVFDGDYTDDPLFFIQSENIHLDDPNKIQNNLSLINITRKICVVNEFEHYSVETWP